MFAVQEFAKCVKARIMPLLMEMMVKLLQIQSLYTRVSQPSYTNFAIPYTGGFTQITASDHDELNKSDRARSRELTETINM